MINFLYILLLDKYAWRGAMWIQGGLALNIIVLTTFLQRPRKSKETETTNGQDVPVNSEKVAKISETVKENFKRITGCRLGSCVCDVLLCVGTIVSIYGHGAIAFAIPKMTENLNLNLDEREYLYLIYRSFHALSR